MKTAGPPEPPARYRRVTTLLAIGWLALVGGSLSWEIWQRHRHAEELARQEARASYHKDMVYRRWATMHGGVYVPSTDRTPSNRYLDLPDRDVTTTSGKALTLMNPAYMTRQVYEVDPNGYGSRGHITSLKPLRPENAADAWETNALQAFERGIREVSSIEMLDGQPFMRFMRPMLVEPGCLKCHARQGYREGDIRGGLSVSVPMTPYTRMARVDVVPYGLIYLALGSLGLGGLWLGRRKLWRYLGERLRVEQSLREEHERLQNILEGTRAGTWEWNLQTEAAVFDERWAQIAGYSLKELAPVSIQTWRALCHPEDLKAATQTLERHCAGELPFYDQEYRLKHKQGRWIWVQDRGCVISRTTAGKPLMMFGTSTDITTRIEHEREIRQKTELMRYIIAHARSAIAVHDHDLRYIFVSERYLQDYGVKERDVIGKHHYEVFPDLPQKWREVHQRALAGEVSNCEEDAYPRQNGSIEWTRWECRPWYEADGAIGGIIVYTEVITERKALEERLRQAQKLESVGQLAGGVAHDFNNILAAIMMHLSLLQQKKSLDLETQEALRELLGEAQRAASLTRQLLAFSRRSVLTTKLLDFNEVIANLLKMLGRLIGEHISVVFERHEGLPAVEADAGMLEQVLMNLALNARDAMPKGGTLTISLTAILADAKRLQAEPQVRPGRFVCLSVTDTGCGMDEATRKRIFDPFFTTKETGKGTGLGLATVHGIVAQHRGWIEVQSEGGKGTTFRVFFPASSKRSENPAKPANLEAIRGQETILLVEDEPGVRQAVAQSLRSLGYVVLEAVNGREAMQVWQQRGPEIDLLFSDMVMPEGTTGLDLAQALRRERPALRVIIASGYTVEITRADALAAQNILYLHKPFQLSVVAKAIRDCLRGIASEPSQPD